MGLIGSLISLGLGMSAVQGIASANDMRHKWMNPEEKKHFDEINARDGIHTEQIVNIARRCKVKTNKYGVIPSDGYRQCLSYVRRYANSEDDIDKFIENWKKTFQQQLAEMPEKIKAGKDAQKYVNLAKQLEIDGRNLPSSTVTYDITHWRYLSKEEHLKRMHEIATKTALKHVLYQPPILRWNDLLHGMYTEFWTVHVDPKEFFNVVGSKRNFRRTYRQCAAYLGYDSES